MCLKYFFKCARHTQAVISCRRYPTVVWHDLHGNREGGEGSEKEND